MNDKLKRKVSCSILRYYLPGVSEEDHGKSQLSYAASGSRSDPGPVEYDAVMLTTRLLHSVMWKETAMTWSEVLT